MKILLGISGGVDSFSSIKLLNEKKYNILLLTFKFWSSDNSFDIIENKVKKISEYFNLPYFIVNKEDYFYNEIVENFIDSYIEGITPNPCVNCNKFIKFKFLYDYAEENNIDFIGTGHYARIEEKNGRYFIKKGLDKNKDQSYFLWRLPQHYLKKIIFPLGEYTKENIKKTVKDIEKDLIMPSESNDICFLKNTTYRDLLLSKRYEIIKNLDKGEFIYNNRVVGYHKGYPFYTIGQRSGLNIALGFPVFVSKIDSKENKVYLAKEEDLYNSDFIVKDINIQKYEFLKEGQNFNVKIRYRNNGTECYIHKIIDDNTIHIKLKEPVKSITPGQSAVFYENEDVVFGGIIYFLRK